VKASAPGKIILFGEHAVVYGHPALAVPVEQVRAEVDVVNSPRSGIWIEAPDIGLHADLDDLSSEHPLAAVIHRVLTALGITQLPALKITITSTIPVASGLGSGAAVSVALVRALSAALQHSLSDERVNEITYEVEKLHHGTPSGIDNTIITYARPVYFVRDQLIETLAVPGPFSIVIGNTGIPAPTRESVSDVRRLWEADRARWDALLEKIGGLARQARAALEDGKLQQLGALMNTNHALLQELTVSSPELDRLVEAARQAGALGAKLSGGGRGGNMIALAGATGAAALAGALESAGSPRVIVTTIQAALAVRS
jgi:mevalonate kinase